jgi:hypothetical protein
MPSLISEMSVSGLHPFYFSSASAIRWLTAPKLE